MKNFVYLMELLMSYIFILVLLLLLPTRVSQLVNCSDKKNVAIQPIQNYLHVIKNENNIFFGSSGLLPIVISRKKKKIFQKWRLI